MSESEDLSEKTETDLAGSVPGLVRLCADCVHFRTGTIGGDCAAPLVDPVGGEGKHLRGLAAYHARRDYCGVSHPIYFEPND